MKLKIEDVQRMSEFNPVQTKIVVELEKDRNNAYDMDELIKLTNNKRPTIYAALKPLISKGFIIKRIVGGKPYYYAKQ